MVRNTKPEPRVLPSREEASREGARPLVETVEAEPRTILTPPWRKTPPAGPSPSERGFGANKWRATHGVPKQKESGMGVLEWELNAPYEESKAGSSGFASVPSEPAQKREKRQFKTSNPTPTSVRKSRRQAGLEPDPVDSAQMANYASLLTTSKAREE